MAPGVPSANRETGKQLQTDDRPWRPEYQLWEKKDRWAGPAPAAGARENRPGPGAKTERAYHTPATASAGFGGPGTGVQGRPAEARDPLCPSPRLGAPSRAGGSRFPQTDDHDLSDAVAGERSDVIHGDALGPPHHAGQPRMSLAHPLC